MKKSPNLNLQIMKMRPIICNTELAFVFPEAEERKVNMSIILYILQNVRENQVMNN